jgi:hypothetical protein
MREAGRLQSEVLCVHHVILGICALGLMQEVRQIEDLFTGSKSRDSGTDGIDDAGGLRSWYHRGLQPGPGTVSAIAGVHGICPSGMY